ncbi:hypothetical protein HY380_00665 [Candidatus Saccharibacteria bacterium]|nr:hypothetical protein [Candidatus Saccharibacteria bacterium]
MRIVALYHPKSDHAGVVEDYAKEYQRFTKRELQLVSLETREGSDMAKYYDATIYPAVLALDNSGRLLKIWQGQPLPLMNDLDAYSQ